MAAWAGVAASAGGGLMGAANAESAMGKAKEIGFYNSIMATAQAIDAERSGAKQVSDFQMQKAGVIGAQRVGYAAQNIDISSGSALATYEDTAQMLERDVQTMRLNTAREAWGYRQQAQNMIRGGSYQAQRFGDQGNASLISGISGAVQSYASYRATQRN